MKELTEHQQSVLRACFPKGRDIPIVVIYARVYGSVGKMTVRQMQQKLAPTFQAINEKRDDIAILPGNLKRTYRVHLTKRK